MPPRDGVGRRLEATNTPGGFENYYSGLGDPSNGSCFSRRRFLAAASAAPRARRPNVLLLDAAAEEGRLGGEGLRFSRAYAACPSCPSARAAILAGRFPHALREAGRCEEATLLSALRRAQRRQGKPQSTDKLRREMGLE